jgi:nicotinamide riboside transporter PnuC
MSKPTKLTKKNLWITFTTLVFVVLGALMIYTAVTKHSQDQLWVDDTTNLGFLIGGILTVVAAAPLAGYIVHRLHK